MPTRYASGKHSIAECDRCGQRYKLVELKKLTIKTKQVNIKVCPECWDPDHPQLQLGMFPVDDPQGLMNPRPDRSYTVSGLNGLHVLQGSSSSQLAQGTNEGGSRIFQWGWNPVGGSEYFDAALTPNNLALSVSIGTVTVATT